MGQKNTPVHEEGTLGTDGIELVDDVLEVDVRAIVLSNSQKRASVSLGTVELN